MVTGAEGQLGRCLIGAAPKGVEVVGRGRGTLDITDPRAVRRVFETLRPSLVFNAAAYTAVDKAESDEAAAHAVNASGVGHLAQAARDAGARLVQVSTDYVFDGACARPYPPDAPTSPLGAYGRTKLAGEHLAGGDALVVRTAWVYAPTGLNFVRTMLRLLGEQPQVRVVADQIGTPTFAPDLARALWTLAEQRRTGIWHYTDAGVASWYDFAVAIAEEALAAGLLERAVPIVPITSAQFPTAAPRPACSLLDTQGTFAALGAPAPHWRANLRRMLAVVKRDG
jgi:dTDP-4-dehydrorhamnose reductase